MARTPKHNYDSDEYYQLLGKLAANGLNDREIADCLSLSICAFSQMKSGRYIGWTEEQNLRRGTRIRETLEASRRKIIATVRQTYIKAALGHIKVKSKVLRHVEVACECGGNDPNCPKCGGVGRIPLSERVIIQETESETPPNMQALATILAQHDAEWLTPKEIKKLNSELPTEVHKGINIGAWIKKELEDKEMEDDSNDVKAELDNEG